MESLQKKILNQSRISQSLYIQNIASLNNTINNNNEGKKHDSYARYLMKKKGCILSNKKDYGVTLKGNKSSNQVISNYSKKCI